MDMTKALVLFGGVSSEHEVSCVSASLVLANIPRDKYTVYALGITKTGEWLLYEGDPSLLPADKWLESGCCTKAVLSPDHSDHGLLVFRETEIEKIHIDVVFPVLHGKNGEDGTMQGLLEISGIPYVGSDTRASAMCMDKAVTNLVADVAGIAQVAWLSTTQMAYEKNPDAFHAQVAEKLGFPVFVKPANAGSSVGISKVKTEAALAGALQTALAHDKKIVVEAAAQDVLEAECAVIGNDEPMASVVGGILPSAEFYDYDAKYNDADSALQIPADITLAQQQLVRETAVRIFTLLGCSGLSRVDFFVEKETGRVLFNEINTIPGFTDISMYAKLLEQSGVPYPKLLDRLFKLAQEKKG